MSLMNSTRSVDRDDVLLIDAEKMSNVPESSVDLYDMRRNSLLLEYHEP